MRVDSASVALTLEVYMADVFILLVVGDSKSRLSHMLYITLGLLTYLLTYLLHGTDRVLLEKLTGFQLVKKFTPFYRNRSFISAFTSVHHLSLS